MLLYMCGCCGVAVGVWLLLSAFTASDYWSLRKISGASSLGSLLWSMALNHPPIHTNHHHHNAHTGLSFCSGVVSGLVLITPGSGFVAPWAAIVIGVVGGAATNGKASLVWVRCLSPH